MKEEEFIIFVRGIFNLNDTDEFYSVITFDEVSPTDFSNVKSEYSFKFKTGQYNIDKKELHALLKEYKRNNNIDNVLYGN